MKYEFDFERLEVYQLALEFVDEIFTILKKASRDIQFSVSDQLRRASLSITNNIAEGSGKTSDKELNRFIDISLGSISELLAAVDVLRDNNFITNTEFDEIFKKLVSISNQLGGFKKKLKKS